MAKSVTVEHEGRTIEFRDRGLIHSDEWTIELGGKTFTAEKVYDDDSVPSYLLHEGVPVHGKPPIAETAELELLAKVVCDRVTGA